MVASNTKIEEIYNEVEVIFTKYLENKELRKTPERYAILKEIYQRKDHFDAEALYIHMKDQNYRVSRATVYNTLELLLACDLIKRHQFSKSSAVFEKSYGFRQHDHIICTDCDEVIEFCDPRIQQIKSMMGDLLDFEILNHSLNLYGKCKQSNCTRKGNIQR
jgi:Fur family ferric uptake transcriptional regulator